MRKLMTLILTAVLAAGCAITGEPPTPAPTNSAGQKIRIGDGVWIVGDEIPEGLWRPNTGIGTMHDCAWFVSPAPKPPNPEPTPTTEPSFRNESSDVELHNGERFTTINCGDWQFLGRWFYPKS